VISVDSRLKELIDYIRSTQIGNNGYVYLLDSKGSVLSHLELSLEQESQKETGDFHNFFNSPNVELREITERMIRGEVGFDTFEDNTGTLQYIAFAPLQAIGWSLGIIIPEKEVLLPTLKLEERLVSEEQKMGQEIEHQRRRVQNFIMTLLFFVMLVFVIIILKQRLFKPSK
jgi:sigma-B regulation protein RsbU (phosphoserine phosphatase)